MVPRRARAKTVGERRVVPSRSRERALTGPSPPVALRGTGPGCGPTELQEARRRSGRLGGRPKKPTVEESRRAALDELVPKALRVLNEHLDKGGPDAWRAALRIFEHQYGRAPEQPEEPFVMPTTAEEVEKLSWGQLLYLAGENAEALGINGTAPNPSQS
jgi:hypothetical protein